MPKSDKIKKRYCFPFVPSRKQHLERNKYNILPSTFIKSSDEYDTFNKHIYIDQSGNKWSLLKWYESIFHNPIHNIKFISYNDNGTSSELIVNKKNVIIKGPYKIINPESFKAGSFNYKDFKLTNNCQHFWADMFPTIIYFSWIGE